MLLISYFVFRKFKISLCGYKVYNHDIMYIFFQLLSRVFEIREDIFEIKRLAFYEKGGVAFKFCRLKKNTSNAYFRQQVEN